MRLVRPSSPGRGQRRRRRNGDGGLRGEGRINRDGNAEVA